MDYIDAIILEEINKAILLETSAKKNKHKMQDKEEKYKELMKYYLHYKNNGFSNKEAHEKAVKKYKEKIKKHKGEEFRTRKKKGGGKESYNYTRYKENNRNVSSGDYEQLANRIDLEKTDLAAVAREVFPNHTDEGAQSQLRKILMGERPMTDKVAEKLEYMISSGQVAIKA